MHRDVKWSFFGHVYAWFLSLSLSITIVETECVHFTISSNHHSLTAKSLAWTVSQIFETVCRSLHFYNRCFFINLLSESAHENTGMCKTVYVMLCNSTDWCGWYMKMHTGGNLKVPSPFVSLALVSAIAYNYSYLPCNSKKA